MQLEADYYFPVELHDNQAIDAWLEEAVLADKSKFGLGEKKRTKKNL